MFCIILEFLFNIFCRMGQTDYALFEIVRGIFLGKQKVTIKS